MATILVSALKVSRFFGLVAFLLVTGAIVTSNTARADWWDVEGPVPSTNHGADAAGAAYDSLVNHFGPPPGGVKDAYMTFTAGGIPDTYHMVGNYVGPFLWEGIGNSDCHTGYGDWAHFITLNGCATRIFGYQGKPPCDCGVGDPINIFSGNK
ncbi:MAG: hypothetical protein ACTHPD_17515, partial [Rhizomicrobium sp.]